MADARASLPSFAEAMRAVRDHAPLASPQRCPLVDALGGTLALPASATADYPAFDMSAMDGFALEARATAAASSASPLALPLGPPGHAGYAAGAGGGAVPISTGAPIPPGCDTVMVRERASVAGATLILSQPVSAGLNIRRRGEDARLGEVVAPAGSPVTPSLIAALACFGVDALDIRRPPRIALLGTGDEIGEAAAGAAVLDSNAPTLRALARAAGVPLDHAGRVGDDPAAIGAAIDAVVAGGDSSIVVTTGGVSAGVRDFVPAALEARGARVIFRGVAMRPGKPVLFAILPGGELFFGLPGNPVAAFLGFRFLVLAAARAAIGLAAERGTAVAVDPALGRPGTTCFLKVRVDEGSISVLPGQQSHRVRALVEANAWLVVDRSGQRPAARLYPLDPASLTAAQIPVPDEHYATRRVEPARENEHG